MVHIGKGAINFKLTTPKILAIESEIIFLAIQALITLGEKEQLKKHSLAD